MSEFEWLSSCFLFFFVLFCCVLFCFVVLCFPKVFWVYVFVVCRHDESARFLLTYASLRDNFLVLFCFDLFCFLLFCFLRLLGVWYFIVTTKVQDFFWHIRVWVTFFLFCFVLFCFVLFCFVLFCFVLFIVYRGVSRRQKFKTSVDMREFEWLSSCFVLFCFVLFCFVLFFSGCIVVYRDGESARLLLRCASLSDSCLVQVLICFVFSGFCVYSILSRRRKWKTVVDISEFGSQELFSCFCFVWFCFGCLLLWDFWWHTRVWATLFLFWR